MGLFDTIHIPKRFLPLTKEELDVVESEDFQTKSFSQSLLEFRVNDDKKFEFNWRSIYLGVFTLPLFGSQRTNRF
jgi:hypothetical protein